MAPLPQPELPVTRKPAILGLAAIGASLGILSLLPQAPVLVWNHTESVPVGLYRIGRAPPVRGDIVVIAPSGGLRATLDAYHVLPRGSLLLKRLAATGGDTVCRNGAVVSINGAPAAIARTATAAGRLLPHWSGCRTLGPDDVLVLTGHPASFDSRYFGPLGADQIIGIAQPVATLPLSGGAA